MIQERYRDRVIALGFTLMKRKKRANYRQLFTMLSDHYESLTGVPLAPRLVITDYEVIYMKSINFILDPNLKVT